MDESLPGWPEGKKTYRRAKYKCLECGQILIKSMELYDGTIWTPTGFEFIEEVKPGNVVRKGKKN